MTPLDIVFVAGIVARPGVGGHHAVFHQYLEGFERLGHRAVLVDHVGRGKECGAAPGHIIGPAGAQAVSHADVLELVGRADLLVNVMGYLVDEEILAAARRRVFLDIDPGFGQMWKELGLADVFAGHHAYVTVGSTLPTSTVPQCGIDWIPSLPPVHLPTWPAAPPAPDAPITSVASWRGPFGPIEYGGTTYGLRVHEFRRFVDLPCRAGARFELALDIDPDDEPDRRSLLDHGWALVDPRTVAATPDDYRDYIGRSKAELMIAKHLYVATGGGWFSDRSACYLATGRPVIAQDTGFSAVLPIGEGLLTFSTPDEAVAAVDDVNRRYEEHCDAARALAVSHFSTDVVLPQLLEAVL